MTHHPRRRTGPIAHRRLTGRPGLAVRAVAAVVLVALAILGPATAASAHAELLTTDPADGSVVATAPRTVTLQFSEGVTVQPDGVRILDREGERVDGGTATASGGVVTVPVEGALPDGGYVVAWRAVSADGHPVRGAFSFSVGTRAQLPSGLAGQAFSGSTDRLDDLVGAVLRGIAYVAVLGVAGAVLIGAALRRDDEPPPVGRLVAGIGGIGLAALLLQLPVQASLATGRGWGSLTEPGVLDLALADGVGWSVALSALSLVALLVTVGLPFRGAARVLAVAGAALAPLGFVVTGHTRSMSPAAVGYLADAAHVLAGAIWFGGLAALLVVVRRRRAADDVGGAAEAVATFSGWAGGIVAVVVVAGTALGWIEVGGWDALVTTSYGQLLLVKVGLVGLVLLGAAWNRFRLVPSLGLAAAETDAAAETETDAEIDAEAETEQAGSGDPVVSVPAAAPGWTALVRVVRLEVLAIVVVLGLTAVLANTTPARTASGGGVVSVRAELGTGSVEVLIDPAKVGRNDIHAYILDADGGVDDRYADATIQLALPAQDLGPLDRTPVRAGPGHFQLVGTDLDLAGEWTFTITVKPDRFTERSATVRFRVR